MGIGRQLLADPAFPLKTAQHRWDAINRCIGCDVCLVQTVLRGRTLSCPINPSLGREVEQRPPPPVPEVPRRVHIVGAGIAGLETAWGLARRGHEVTLWEQAAAPGGVLQQVAALPAVPLRDLAAYGAYVERALVDLGVELRLNTWVTADLLQRAGGETVVLATGARPATLNGPDVPQGLPVVSWPAYLAGQGPRGECVAVVSNGEGGGIWAVSLARTGYRVWLLERGATPQPAAYDYAGRRLQALTDALAEAGVGVVGLVDTVWPSAGGVTLGYRNGFCELLPVDAVLVAGRPGPRGARPHPGPARLGRLPGGGLCDASGDCGGPPGRPVARDAGFSVRAERAAGPWRVPGAALPRQAQGLPKVVSQISDSIGFSGKITSH